MAAMVLFSVVLAITMSAGFVEPKSQDSIALCSNPARLYADPEDCRKFIRCINKKPVSFSCPPKTAFDPDTQICAWRVGEDGCVAVKKPEPTVRWSEGFDDVPKRQTPVPKTNNRWGKSYQKAQPEIIRPRPTQRPVTPKPRSSRFDTRYNQRRVTRKPWIYNGNFQRQISSKSTAAPRMNFNMEKINPVQLGRKKTTVAPSEKPSTIVPNNINGWFEAMNRERSAKNIATSASSISVPENIVQDTKQAVQKGVPTESQETEAQENSILSEVAEPVEAETENTEGQATDAIATKDEKNEDNESSEDQDDALSTTTVSVQTEESSTANVTATETREIIQTESNGNENILKQNNTGNVDEDSHGTVENVSMEAYSSKMLDFNDTIAEKADSEQSSLREEIIKTDKDNVTDQDSDSGETTTASRETTVSQTEDNRKTTRAPEEQSTNDNFSNSVEVGDAESTKTLLPSKSEFVGSKTVSIQRDYPNYKYLNLNPSPLTMHHQQHSQYRHYGQKPWGFGKNRQRSRPYMADFDFKPHKYLRMVSNNDEEESGKSSASDNAVDPFNFVTSKVSVNPAILPASMKYLTGKIVDRELLTTTEAVKPRWYDRETDSNKTTTTTAVSRDASLEMNETKTPNGAPDKQVINITESTNESQNSTTTTTTTTTTTAATTTTTAAATTTTATTTIAEEAKKTTASSDSDVSTVSATVASSTTSVESTVFTTATAPPENATESKDTETVTTQTSTTLGTAESILADVNENVSFLSAPYMVRGLVRPFRCPEPEGHFPDPKDCSVYYHCSGNVAYRRDCPPGQVFHQGVFSCVSSSLAPPCPHAYISKIKEDDEYAKSICLEPHGLYRDTFSCAHYYECTDGWPIRRKCMVGTVFDDALGKCSWSKFVPGCEVDETADSENSVSRRFRAHVFRCPHDGYFRDPQWCSVYYHCNGGEAVRMSCDPGTSFDLDLNVCVWTSLVQDCDDNGVVTSGEWEGAEQVTMRAQQDIMFPTKQGPSSSFEYPKGFICPEENGVFPDPTDCRIYYTCLDDVATAMRCPAGTGYDVVTGLCMERMQVALCMISKNNDDIMDNLVLDKAAFKCPEAHGLYPDPSNCSAFIHCFKKIAYRHQCQPGTVFSSKKAACTWRHLVPECQNEAEVHVKDGQHAKMVDNVSGYKSKSQKYQAKNSVAHGNHFQPDVTGEPYQSRVSYNSRRYNNPQPIGIQDFECPTVVDGFFRDNMFCDIFHRCVLGQRFTFTCPTGTFFRLDGNLCDFWESITDCTQDGVRIDALGSLPEVAPLPDPVPVPRPVPNQYDVDVVGIDTEPTPCPAASGLFAHPRNCRQFLFCAHYIPLVLTCPESLLYNAQTLTCDFPKNVQCYRYDDYMKK